MLVLSAGTYRLFGNILDATSGDPVPGARLEASVDANGSLPPNAVATAGPDGKYILYGVPAVSDIRVTQGGYLPTTTRVALAFDRCVRDGVDRGCAFVGRASASGATFQLTTGTDNGFIEPPDLMEFIFADKFALPTLLWFLGTATTNFSATGLLGSLAGTITLFPAWSQPSIASCGAGRFDLSRR